MTSFGRESIKAFNKEASDQLDSKKIENEERKTTRQHSLKSLSF